MTTGKKNPGCGTSRVWAVLPAAGRGVRLGAKVPKALVRIGSAPLFVWTIRAIESSYPFEGILLVAGLAESPGIQRDLKRYRLGHVKLVPGGMTRAESVRNGLRHIPDKKSWVLIHDVARPLVGAGDIRKVIQSAKRSGAAILAHGSTQTVKEADPKSGWIRRTLDRRRIFFAQTPQVFRKDALEACYKRRADWRRFTDESGLLEAAGRKVRLVAGSGANIKITEPEDLVWAAETRKEVRLRRI